MTPPQAYVEKNFTFSGEHPDFEGIIFGDGTVAVRWLTSCPCTQVWGSYEEFYQVHGHPDYNTRIDMSDELPPSLLSEKEIR